MLFEGDPNAYIGYIGFGVVIIATYRFFSEMLKGPEQRFPEKEVKSN